MKRTKSFNYSRLNLRGLVALAGLADQVDVDLWHYETADGRSLRKALDFMLPYVKTPPEKWPYQQIVPIDRSELFGAFRSAAIAYQEPRYEQVVAGDGSQSRSPLPLLNPAPAPASKAKSVSQAIRESGVKNAK